MTMVLHRQLQQEDAIQLATAYHGWSSLRRDVAGPPEQRPFCQVTDCANGFRKDKTSLASVNTLIGRAIGDRPVLGGLCRKQYPLA